MIDFFHRFLAVVAAGTGPVNDEGKAISRHLPRDRFSLQPWNFAKQATDDEKAAQVDLQQTLTTTGRLTIGAGAYISPEAEVSIGKVALGNGSSIGGGCQVGIEVSVGDRCTINPGSVVRGKVRIGHDTRIATGAQILGFNHSWSDLERPIWQQPLTKEGIDIGEDCWIGANAVVLDGVTIGDHAIVGAGAIVTKHVPAWTIVAGNPARVIQSRKYGRPGYDGSLNASWQTFVAMVRQEMPDVLARSLVDGNYLDHPTAAPTLRALADAVELSAMVGCDVPGFDKADLVQTLSAWQDPATGLVPGPYAEDDFDSASPRAGRLEFGRSAYGVLACGYALECLGARLAHPVRVAHDLSPENLRQKLDRLPWDTNAWQAGAWIDHFASACDFNARQHGLLRDMSDLRNWLESHADTDSGLWGAAGAGRDFLHPVNGFYRLTRGAHAQAGWPLASPERVIDTVLAHAHDPRHMSSTTATACNVLDVIHPLMLCGRQTSHRRPEVQAVARFWLDRTMTHWTTGAGMTFKLDDTLPPRLQGTEMWLAIAWLCAFVLGIASGDDDFRPKGIHRL